jgi:FeS assembly protein IscX
MWDEPEDIADALLEAYPDRDPLELSFPTLHKIVCGLKDFGDDPGKSSEGKLEAIQMAWYEMVKA